MASADDEEEYRALCASARPEDCVLWEECLKQTDLEFDYAPADVEKAEFQPMSTHFDHGAAVTSAAGTTTCIAFEQLPNENIKTNGILSTKKIETATTSSDKRHNSDNMGDMTDMVLNHVSVDALSPCLNDCLEPERLETEGACFLETSVNLMSNQPSQFQIPTENIGNMSLDDLDSQLEYLCASACPEDCALWEDCLKESNLEFVCAPADVEEAEFQPIPAHSDHDVVVPSIEEHASHVYAAAGKISCISFEDLPNKPENIETNGILSTNKFETAITSSDERHNGENVADMVLKHVSGDALSPCLNDCLEPVRLETEGPCFLETSTNPLSNQLSQFQIPTENISNMSLNDLDSQLESLDLLQESLNEKVESLDSMQVTSVGGPMELEDCFGLQLPVDEEPQHLVENENLSWENLVKSLDDSNLDYESFDSMVTSVYVEAESDGELDVAVKEENYWQDDGIDHLSMLPDEVLLRILHFLPAFVLLQSVAPISRRFRVLVDDRSLWRHLDIGSHFGRCFRLHPSFLRNRIFQNENQEKDDDGIERDINLSNLEEDLEQVLDRLQMLARVGKNCISSLCLNLSNWGSKDDVEMILASIPSLFLQATKIKKFVIECDIRAPIINAINFVNSLFDVTCSDSTASNPCETLQELRLRGCVVDCRYIHKFMNLHTLDVGYLAPSDSSLSALKECPSLKHLTLRCNLNGSQVRLLFDISDEENSLRFLESLVITVSVIYTQLMEIFVCCSQLKQVKLHFFDLLPLSAVTPKDLELTSRRARAEYRVENIMLSLPKTLKALQITTCLSMETIAERTHGHLPRDLFVAANQLPNLEEFSCSLFQAVEGFKTISQFLDLALDRTTCLLPPLIKTLNLKCTKFENWRDIRSLLDLMYLKVEDLSLGCRDFDIPMVGSIPSAAFFKPFQRQDSIQSLYFDLKEVDLPHVLRILENFPFSLKHLSLWGDSEFSLNSFIFRVNPRRLNSLKTLEIYAKSCGNSFDRLGDLAPNLQELRLLPPDNDAPCVPIGQLPQLKKFRRLQSAKIHFRGEVGGGHRSAHWIEHFLKNSFFHNLDDSFPSLRDKQFELMCRPVGATPDKTLKLVLFRSCMGNILHYWES